MSDNKFTKLMVCTKENRKYFPEGVPLDSDVFDYLTKCIRRNHYIQKDRVKCTDENIIVSDRVKYIRVTGPFKARIIYQDGEFHALTYKER